MKKVYFILIIISLSSCLLSEHYLNVDLKRISSINYKEDVICDYSIGDARESSVYFINYEGNRYIARMPLVTDSLISLKLLKEKIDSAGNWVENEVYDLSNDLDIKIKINDICLIFRNVWQLDQRNIHLLEMNVEKNKDITLILRWMHRDNYIIIVSDNFTAKNMDELVSYIKDGPVKLNHINENQIKDKAGYVKFDKHLYYKNIE